MKNLKPMFFEHSSIPVWLSKLAPIEINAITLFCFVFSRGVISEKTRRHEAIHFQQYLETGVIGFVALYLLEFLVRLCFYRSGRRAYRMISFEQEAHDWDSRVDYLEIRKRYTWLSGLLRY